MITKTRLVLASLTAILVLTFFTFELNAKLRVQFPGDEMVYGEKKGAKAALKEIELFYDNLEGAIGKEDIDALMALYADDYNHNGVDKAHLSRLWERTFTLFEDLYSVHIFSSIDLKGGEAILVCTGVLYGKPVGSGTHEIVDNWAAQNHRLVRTAKGGSWQMAGGATHWYTKKGERPGGLSYRLEFHPFF